MRYPRWIALLGLLAFATAATAEEVPKNLPDAKRVLYEELDREIQKMKAGETDDEPCPEVSMAASQPTFPYLEHHGYFRTRLQGYYRLHLGTQAVDKDVYTSGFLPPLTENRVNNETGGDFSPDDVGSTHNEDWISDLNMRLRYSPLMRITKDLAVAAQFDIMDNVVFGSTPDFPGYERRADVPLAIFSGSQVPPTSDVNGWSDSIRVKQAYGEWIFPLAELRVGRMADDWGMGVVASGGQDIDDDYGDFVDRVSIVVPFRWFTLHAAVDWLFEGATSATPDTLLGAVHDLDDADDATQFVLSLTNKPRTDEDWKLRQLRLHTQRKPVLDWGLYTQARYQRFDVAADSYDAYMAGTATPNELRLVPRDAWMVTPDLWLRLLYSWAPDMLLRVELEAALSVGRVGNVLMTKAAHADTDILSGGGVLQTEMQIKQFSFGVEGGMATGDANGSFGYWGPSLLAWQDAATGNTVVNSRLTAFRFDRDYRTDLILYRYVVGGVTNSWYLKPWFQYDFLPGDEGELGARLSTMYARAIEAQGTPGQAHDLGVEIDLSLFFSQTGRFTAALDWGTLIPLGALDRAVAPSASAKFAMLLRTRLIWSF